MLYPASRSPLLFVLGKPKRDPRTDFAFAFIAAGAGLCLGNIGVNFVSLSSLLPAILLVSLATCAGLFLLARNTSGPRGAWIVMVMLSGSYGYGLVTSGDTLPDHAKPERYSVSIVGKHTTSGRSTSYYLDLAPWGPIQDENRLGVSKRLYDAAGVGDLTCLELHQGYLHAPWYRQVEWEPLRLEKPPRNNRQRAVSGSTVTRSSQTSAPTPAASPPTPSSTTRCRCAAAARCRWRAAAARSRRRWAWSAASGLSR